MIRYLLDENLSPIYKTQIFRRNPNLVVWAVGEPGAPQKGTLDTEILSWCEEQNFILPTNHRASMPVHLREHLEQDRHIPGIFILNVKLTMGQNIEKLILIPEGFFEDEYEDQINYLPLSC